MRSRHDIKRARTNVFLYRESGKEERKNIRYGRTSSKRNEESLIARCDLDSSAVPEYILDVYLCETSTQHAFRGLYIWGRVKNVLSLRNQCEYVT